RDFTIPANDWNFWLQHYWRVLPQLESTRADRKSQQRPRGKRPKRLKRDQSNPKVPQESIAGQNLREEG
ncbi:MAG: hypothetical protein KDD34_00730, partial [Bdellovibrionales bacterium]|nr:hypothetical protein [Bdellovibrionales bacterium]